MKSVSQIIVTIRRAVVADLPAVTRLRQHLSTAGRSRRPDIYRPTPLGQTEALFLTQLTYPGDAIYVAEADCVVIGYAWTNTGDGTGNDGMFPRRYTYVYQLVVDPAAQQQGAGRALLAAIEADATADGVEVLQLNVDATNEEARVFYDRVGWATVSEMRQKLLREVRRIERE